mmetsp:Transcript_67086/g.143544  ORF Transcript_67086/g.143544 Transcript_67086/m.143544 type:complete len:258 (+) Transcript_67086:779-1552(+)
MPTCWRTRRVDPWQPELQGRPCGRPTRPLRLLPAPASASDWETSLQEVVQAAAKAPTMLCALSTSLMPWPRCRRHFGASPRCCGLGASGCFVGQTPCAICIPMRATSLGRRWWPCCRPWACIRSARTVSRRTTCRVAGVATLCGASAAAKRAVRSPSTNRRSAPLSVAPSRSPSTNRSAHLSMAPSSTSRRHRWGSRLQGRARQFRLRLFGRSRLREASRPLVALGASRPLVACRAKRYLRRRWPRLSPTRSRKSIG